MNSSELMALNCSHAATHYFERHFQFLTFAYFQGFFIGNFIIPGLILRFSKARLTRKQRLIIKERNINFVKISSFFYKLDAKKTFASSQLSLVTIDSNERFGSKNGVASKKTFFESFHCLNRHCKPLMRISFICVFQSQIKPRHINKKEENNTFCNHHLYKHQKPRIWLKMKHHLRHHL